MDNNALNAFSLDQEQKIDESIKLSLLETKIFDADILLHYKVLS
jgi:riboflavin biosynthesis pyrimidine reductase